MDRQDPKLNSDERTMLEEFLEYHRATFRWKISTLAKGQLSYALPSSTMTLAGLAKHLAYVEDIWFHVRLAGHDTPTPWADAPFDADPDWEWHSAVDDEPDTLAELYGAACTRSRLAVGRAASLDVQSVVPDRQTGEKFSLRWILLHLIEETARHNGHADLLREAIDGQSGE
jgi:uncharacterized damage-inducible protein DinB